MRKQIKKTSPSIVKPEDRLFCEEQITLAMLYYGADECLSYCKELSKDDLADPEFRRVFETATELKQAGRPADGAAIAAAAQVRGDTLNKVATFSPIPEHCEHYAARVKGFSKCDRVMKSATPLARAGDDVGLSMLFQDYAIQMPSREVATVAADWLQVPDEEIHSIVNGLFDAKNRVAIVGQSKARKSWFALQLAISLVSGAPFLGLKVSSKKRVLLVNGEIDSAAYKKRLRMMLQGAHVASEGLAGLIICNTSEDCTEWNIGRILAMAKAHHVDVTIVDPFYLLIDDEIDQTKVKECVRLMKRFASAGIALVSVFHATKGRIGDKQVIDRVAGSGIFARDCSTLVSLCEHATEQDHIVMACEIRNHPPMPPATLHFTDSCFRLADGVAAVEKTSSTKPTRKFDHEAVARCIEGRMTYKAAVEAVQTSQGVGRNRAVGLIGQMVISGLLETETQGRCTFYQRKETV